jgi:glyoxylase-like metal-dependent hydrolase (beta-lactamase superfamily II)
MKIDHLVLGKYENNSYILRSSDKASDCVIIDTSLPDHRLIDFLKHHDLNPLAVILTHGHADHIMGLAELRTSYPDIKVYIHSLDQQMLTDSALNLAALAGQHFETDPADVIIKDGDKIELADINLKVLHTPGHTQGGICLYAEKDVVVFVGDTLFADSVGRTDFPGGDMHQLIEAIKTKLLTLPEETKVYPGHGPATTIKREKNHNQYLR